MNKKILNAIHLPRKVKSYPNGQKYYHSIITGKLKKLVELNKNRNSIKERLYRRNSQVTYEYVFVNGKKKLSELTIDTLVKTQNKDDQTPWIIKSIQKTFSFNKEVKTITTKEYSAPYYQMGKCTTGKIDTYEGGKIVSTQDVSGQY